MSDRSVCEIPKNSRETIRDRGLYREGFKTFEDYCKGRWGIARSYASYLVSGAQIATNLLTGVNLCTPCEIQPVHEQQVRPLALLDPEDLNQE